MRLSTSCGLHRDTEQLAILHETWAYYLWNLSPKTITFFWQDTEKLRVFLARTIFWSLVFLPAHFFPRAFSLPARFFPARFLPAHFFADTVSTGSTTELSNLLCRKYIYSILLYHRPLRFHSAWPLSSGTSDFNWSLQLPPGPLNFTMAFPAQQVLSVALAR